MRARAGLARRKKTSRNMSLLLAHKIVDFLDFYPCRNLILNNRWLGRFCRTATYLNWKKNNQQAMYSFPYYLTLPYWQARFGGGFQCPTVHIYKPPFRRIHAATASVRLSFFDRRFPIQLNPPPLLRLVFVNITMVVCLYNVSFRSSFVQDTSTPKGRYMRRLDLGLHPMWRRP